MYSLKITVAAISFCSSYEKLLLLNQYSKDVEASLSYGQGYLIPSLIWPPPAICVKPDLYRVCSFISSHFEVNS